jgi:hypothetical protein
MGKKRLDPDLLSKMASRTGKDKQYLREQISRKASRGSVSSLAAQLLWAKRLGLGITSALNRAEASVREEVRGTPSSPPTSASPASSNRSARQKKTHPITGTTIDFLLQDSELRGRCRDLVLAKKHHDRVVREATTVLDDRLKNLSTITSLNPGALVGKVLNPDPSQAVIVVSPDPGEQRGFFNICQGVMLAFRNKAHHSLSNAFTQADALKFCGFVDALLSVIGKGTVHLNRI